LSDDAARRRRVPHRLDALEDDAGEIEDPKTRTSTTQAVEESAPAADVRRARLMRAVDGMLA
jgi:hypothetical protein